LKSHRVRPSLAARSALFGLVVVGWSILPGCSDETSVKAPPLGNKEEITNRLNNPMTDSTGTAPKKKEKALPGNSIKGRAPLGQ